MKTKQLVKLNMFNALQEVMDKNKPVWSEVEKLKQAFDKFKENNIRLNELKNENEKDLNPVVNAKADLRKTLINSTVPSLNVILAFAHENGDKELLKKFNFSRNKLTKSKDLDLIEKCKSVFKTAEKLFNKSVNDAEKVDSKLKENKIDILSFGLTEEMLAELEKTEKDFIDSHLALRDTIELKNKSAKKITEVIKVNDKLLKNNLDLLLSIFESSHPEFYANYTNARIIPKKEKTEEPVKKVKIKKDELKLKKEPGKNIKEPTE